MANQLEAVQAFVKAHNPKDLVDTNQFLAMRKEVLTSLKGNGEWFFIFNVGQIGGTNERLMCARQSFNHILFERR